MVVDLFDDVSTRSPQRCLVGAGKRSLRGPVPRQARARHGASRPTTLSGLRAGAAWRSPCNETARPVGLRTHRSGSRVRSFVPPV